MMWWILMLNESFKHRLSEIFGEKRNPTPRTLVEIVEMSGYSRATVHKWLKELESEGAVEKKTVVKGLGRPTMVYYPGSAILVTDKTGGIEHSASTLGVFPVHFERLQHACIHSRYGYCKETVQECHPDTCYLIRKKAELLQRAGR
jgi:DNA-binding transcriptional ArsR family regulator